MAKAIKLTNSRDEVIAIVDNATKALKAAEKYSCCSLTTKLGTFNKDLNNTGTSLIFNCQDGIIYAEVITGSALEIRLEKQFLNCAITAELFR